MRPARARSGRASRGRWWPATSRARARSSWCRRRPGRRPRRRRSPASGRRWPPRTRRSRSRSRSHLGSQLGAGLLDLLRGPGVLAGPYRELAGLRRGDARLGAAVASSRPWPCPESSSQPPSWLPSASRPAPPLSAAVFWPPSGRFAVPSSPCRCVFAAAVFGGGGLPRARLPGRVAFFAAVFVAGRLLARPPLAAVFLARPPSSRTLLRGRRRVRASAHRLPAAAGASPAGLVARRRLARVFFAAVSLAARGRRGPARRRTLLHGGLLRHHGRGPFTYVILLANRAGTINRLRTRGNGARRPIRPSARPRRGEPASVVPSSPPGNPPDRRRPRPSGHAAPVAIRVIPRPAAAPAPHGRRETGLPPRPGPYTGPSERHGWGRVAPYAARSDPGTV